MKILKIILSVISLVVIGVTLYYLNNPKTNSCLITIEIVYEEYSDIKEYDLSEYDSLEHLLDSNYEIIMKNGMLIKIDDLYTPNTSAEFIKIFINNSPATKGIKGIVLNDFDKVTFKIDKTYG